MRDETSEPSTSRRAGAAKLAARIVAAILLVAAQAADAVGSVDQQNNILARMREYDREAPVDYGPGPGIPRARAGFAAAAAPLASSAQIPLGNAAAAMRGMFGAVASWPIIPLHTTLLPDGRVLNYGTSETGAQGAQLIYDIWNPALGTGSNAHMILPNTTPTDIFCSAAAIMWTTGDVLISGGDLTINGTRNFANNGTNTFTPGTNLLKHLAPMAEPRWYPTLLSLHTGEMLVMGGSSEQAVPTYTPEIFTAATGWRQLTGAKSQAAFGNTSAGYANWYYPRAFVTFDSRILIVGVDGAMFMLTPSESGYIKTIAQKVPVGSVELPSVMYAPGKILTVRANAQAFVIDITGANPVVTQTASLSQVRDWSSATVLPDGRVLVTGGSSVSYQLTGTDYNAEIWNPSTGKWTIGAAATKPRLYHSIALLLPDGSVLTGGGGAPGPVKNLNAEIYYPPYLYNSNGSGQPAARPTIIAAPLVASSGTQAQASVNAGDSISRVTFVRMGTDTHSFDPEQRFIGLPFTQAGTQVSFTLPGDTNIVTPGYWMLFVFNKAGTPSVARTVLVQK